MQATQKFPLGLGLSPPLPLFLQEEMEKAAMLEAFRGENDVTAVTLTSGFEGTAKQRWPQLWESPGPPLVQIDTCVKSWKAASC